MALSCATFTASVSTVPAATLVIWRVLPAEPTLTAASVALVALMAAICAAVAPEGA